MVFGLILYCSIACISINKTRCNKSKLPWLIGTARAMLQHKNAANFSNIPPSFSNTCLSGSNSNPSFFISLKSSTKCLKSSTGCLRYNMTHDAPISHDKNSTCIENFSFECETKVLIYLTMSFKFLFRT